MSRTPAVVVESECIINNLDYPENLDHAWLFVAAGIHARPYKRTVEDQYVPCIVKSIRQVGVRKYILAVSEFHRWSDGAPILAAEVAKALCRGKCAGIFRSVRVIGSREVGVVMEEGAVLVREILASALFTLTPSCRSSLHKQVRSATCGPYILAASSPDKRVMTFRRRKDISIVGPGPAEVTVVVTENRDQGIRLIQDGRITLSCPLGANPAIFSRLRAENTIANRLTNLALVLRPYPNCSLARDMNTLSTISKALQRHRLAQITAGTFVPMLNVSQIFKKFEAREELKQGRSPNISTFKNNGSLIPGLTSLEIRYAEFEPNRQIAEDIGAQLYSCFGVPCSLAPVSYDDYVASRFSSKCGMSLEIIQPILPDSIFQKKWGFFDAEGNIDAGKSVLRAGSGQRTLLKRTIAIPLLQAVTSGISYEKRYKSKGILTAEAIADWAYL